MSTVFSKAYGLDVGERAIRTFAQALAAVWVAGAVTGLADVDWATSLSVAGMASVMSVLMSIGAGFLPETGDASLLPSADTDENDFGSEGGPSNTSGGEPEQWR